MPLFLVFQKNHKESYKDKGSNLRKPYKLKLRGDAVFGNADCPLSLEEVWNYFKMK